jgi:hypothetical protein
MNALLFKVLFNINNNVLPVPHMLRQTNYTVQV